MDAALALRSSLQFQFRRRHALISNYLMKLAGPQCTSMDQISGVFTRHFSRGWQGYAMRDRQDMEIYEHSASESDNYYL